VGSGLILLVIVGAWLAVLVPMAVRSHDSTSVLKSADRFSDAMRVLSARRSGGERREAPVSQRPSDRLVPPLTAAERRRRTLLALLGAALLTLGLALLGPTVFLVLHVVCDLLLVGFVVHLRRLELRRTARVPHARRPAAPAAAPARQAAPARLDESVLLTVPAAPRTAGIPDRMPARPAPLTAPLPAPAARYDDASAATGTDGSWSPVPVPPPTYVGKPAAPPRPPRVLDLTKPGEWSAALEDVGLDLLDEGPEIEDILDRRRAANGW
jgi:hypothetical protein